MNIEQRLRRIEEKVSQKKKINEGIEEGSDMKIYITFEYAFENLLEKALKDARLEALPMGEVRTNLKQIIREVSQRTL